jgi:hypothetical protein
MIGEPHRTPTKGCQGLRGYAATCLLIWVRLICIINKVREQWSGENATIDPNLAVTAVQAAAQRQLPHSFSSEVDEKCLNSSEGCTSRPTILEQKRLLFLPSIARRSQVYMRKSTPQPTSTDILHSCRNVFK